MISSGMNDKQTNVLLGILIVIQDDHDPLRISIVIGLMNYTM